MKSNLRSLPIILLKCFLNNTFEIKSNDRVVELK
jgi:hypothetical protein